MIKLPCGQILEVKHSVRGRKYYIEGNQIWDPSKVHRTALLQAILLEDGFKYKTPKCPVCDGYIKAGDETHRLSNGNFCHEECSIYLEEN